MTPTPNFDPIVYVVDDDPAVLDSVSLLIRSAGLKVMAFPSALEFLAAFIPNQIACLVLDIRMPGTTGLELQAELEGAGVALPIIFITGHGDVAQ
jgi:FixJ family two-component response regulator